MRKGNLGRMTREKRKIWPFLIKKKKKPVYAGVTRIK